uniref:Uncharacterized protein n=1 Tax=Fagus sylvatica TaxID=28930 RepID=A0A2N9ELN5_FAGSY
MASVVLMLNSYSITLARPSQLAFFMDSNIESNTSSQGEHDPRVTKPDQSKGNLVKTSINEASITELSPH